MRPEKRSRGRPKGSSRHNAQDKRTLEMVADSIVRDRRLKATTAMRRLGKSDEASLRRLQRKWVREKSELLVRAQEDYRQERTLEVQRRSENALAQWTDQMTARQRAFDTSAFSRIAAESERMQRLFWDNPAFEAMARLRKQSEQLAHAMQPSVELARLVGQWEAQAKAAQRMAGAIGTVDIDSILIKTTLGKGLFRG